MGMTPSILRLMINLHKRFGFSGPVLTLGNQDIWASYVDLKGYFQQMDCPYRELKSIMPHTSQLFAERKSGSPQMESFVHAKVFFEMLGIQDYCDMDIAETDHPVIRHDLNHTVPAHLKGRFNLVVDSGTIEHVFDVRQVMNNLVDMVACGGWAIHCSPASNFLDHGYYSFSPSFFFDYYAVNGFSDFCAYFIMSDPSNLMAASPYFEYRYGMPLEGLVDPRRLGVVLFAAKKQREVDVLSIPQQGDYRRCCDSATIGAATDQLMRSNSAGMGSESRDRWRRLRLLYFKIRKRLRPEYSLLWKI